ncbi:unnamed protein product, partial [Gongylonema pulchrum]|uniref:Uncharacterized protein n=1 Tax=Gongylonema pulchrum TaxID=637853 RepID=A0A183DPL5_9BILA
MENCVGVGAGSQASGVVGLGLGWRWPVHDHPSLLVEVLAAAGDTQLRAPAMGARCPKRRAIFKGVSACAAVVADASIRISRYGRPRRSTATRGRSGGRREGDAASNVADESSLSSMVKSRKSLDECCEGWRACKRLQSSLGGHLKMWMSAVNRSGLLEDERP